MDKRDKKVITETRVLAIDGIRCPLCNTELIYNPYTQWDECDCI